MKFLTRYLVAIFTCVLSLSTLANESDVKERYPFESDDQYILFSQLTKELRCPKCLNQNIADSNAGVAMDLKNKTYELVKEGKSKGEVIDFMVQRYGNFVTYQPPINMITIWLWLIPILFASVLGFLIYSRSQKNKLNTKVASDSALARAKQLLDEQDK